MVSPLQWPLSEFDDNPSEKDGDLYVYLFLTPIFAELKWYKIKPYKSKPKSP